MFTMRSAVTPHMLMGRLSTWCRQHQWRDERVITEMTAWACREAVLVGSHHETAYAEQLAKRAVQDRVDALNQAALGVAGVGTGWGNLARLLVVLSGVVLWVGLATWVGLSHEGVAGVSILWVAALTMAVWPDQPRRWAMPTGR